MNDRSNRPVETPHEWLRYAEQDLRVADPGDIIFEDIGPAEARETLDAARRIRARVLEQMRK